MLPVSRSSFMRLVPDSRQFSTYLLPARRTDTVSKEVFVNFSERSEVFIAPLELRVSRGKQVKDKNHLALVSEEGIVSLFIPKKENVAPFSDLNVAGLEDPQHVINKKQELEKNVSKKELNLLIASVVSAQIVAPYSLSSKIVRIRDLIFEGKLVEAMKAYKKLYGEFYSLSIWPKDVIGVSLQLVEECMKENNLSEILIRNTESILSLLIKQKYPEAQELLRAFHEKYN